MLPYKKQFIVITLMMFVGIGIQLTTITHWLYCNVSNDALTQTDKLYRIILMGVVFIVSLVVGNVVNYYQSIMLQRVGQQTVVTLRDDVFRHIENLDIAQINQVPVGKLVTRVANDTNTISEMYTSVAVNLVKNVIYIFAILIVIFVISVKISLFVLTVIPFVIIASMFF